MSTKTLPPRSRRSKAEVESEFSQIRELIEQEKQERAPKDEEFAQLREAEIKTATQGVTPETVVHRLSAMELEVSKALSGLSSQLLAETKLLSSLREAVALEQTELERLHKIEIAKTALDQMVQEYAELNARLAKESEEARAQWAVEQATQERSQKQYEEELKRQRQREKEEYEYNRDLQRKKEQEQLADALHAQERQNKEKQEALEKNWAARESALKEREEELARLRQESAQFPERLKKEMDRAIAEATKALQVEHRQAFVIVQKDMESEKRLAAVQLKSLEETVARQSEEIKSLASRLDDAKKQVQEIALQAIESASGAKALSHVNQIAMEQAKTRSAQP